VVRLSGSCNCGKRLRWVAQYDHRPWIYNPEAKPPDNEWLTERRLAFDKVGSELVAFANSNILVTRLLRQKGLWRYRCYVRSAGENLRTLAEAYPGTQSWNALHESVVSNLKIQPWP